MEHTVRISLSNRPADGGIVACRHVSVREKLLRVLFGAKTRLTVIVPGDTVEELAIHAGHFEASATLPRVCRSWIFWVLR